MIIPEIPNINHIRETENNKETARSKTQISISTSDNVTIDQESRLVSKLLSQIKTLQNDRCESSCDLKLKIANGEYNPSSEEIAKSILYGSPKNRF